MKLILTLFFLLPAIIPVTAQHVATELGVSKAYSLKKINELRTQGCRCNGVAYMPVNKLNWNDQLEISAMQHAKSMYENDFFSHYSLDGKDIGQRLDDVGYKWQYAGENLAEGQKSFDEALRDWIASDTHCKMLMNPDMREMAIAKYGSYWVQHFGTKMPPKTKRVGRHYSEGE